MHLLKSAVPVSLITIFATLLAIIAMLVPVTAIAAPSLNHAQETQTMQLGAFSISLAVQDIHASKAFYEKLGFKEIGGNIEQNWLILRNGATTIGLFHGMFENNIMTFNPGWDGEQNTLGSFDDVREIQERLKDQGVELQTEADPEGKGPASFVVVDPDGNAILVDQHVDAPGSSSKE